METDAKKDGYRSQRDSKDNKILSRSVLGMEKVTKTCSLNMINAISDTNNIAKQDEDSFSGDAMKICV